MSIGEWKIDAEFFLLEQHKECISEALICLKSDVPFCLFQSEVESYLDYYKEVLVNQLKKETDLKLLYFDPKFGDDLSLIINKELEDIDISLVGSSTTDRVRKIIIVDNESFAKNLDWELIDSLRSDLKAANIGAFSIDPRSEHDESELEGGDALNSYKCVKFQKMTKQEQKELKECISQHPEKDQLSQIVDKILRAKPRQRTNEEHDKGRDQKGIIKRLGSLFSRD